MENLKEQESHEHFCVLRNRLLQRLEESWEDSDTEVLELIDGLMLEYSREVYLSIVQRKSEKRIVSVCEANGYPGRAFRR